MNDYGTIKKIYSRGAGATYEVFNCFVSKNLLSRKDYKIYASLNLLLEELGHYEKSTYLQNEERVYTDYVDPDPKKYWEKNGCSPQNDDPIYYWLMSIPLKYKQYDRLTRYICVLFFFYGYSYREILTTLEQHGFLSISSTSTIHAKIQKALPHLKENWNTYVSAEFPISFTEEPNYEN